jgi:hypothetical protein
MNNVLLLKGQFDSKPNTSGGGKRNLPANAKVSSTHVESLIKELSNISVFWKKKENDIIGGALVSVFYKHVVAKSNRLQNILGKGDNNKPNSSIRGAKFVWEKNDHGKTIQKHVFTHFVSVDIIDDSINRLKLAKGILEKYYNGEATQNTTREINDGHFQFKEMSKTTFISVLIDCFYVERFGIDKSSSSISEDSIVTIYKTGVDTQALLKSFGIDMINAKMIDETTLRLTPNEIKLVQDKAPYLISMSVRDFSDISLEDVDDVPMIERNDMIGEPGDEPTIGVIDTLFWKEAYFSNWVEYHKMISDEFEIDNSDMRHGTAVTSIIVDGPNLNPNLDDGCGNFKVRHFGVSKAGPFSSFTVLKLIRKIVAENTDIKVWNLSLGSVLEIDPNFISPEAAELDKIQSEYDVVFVVAGTNKKKDEKKDKMIGAPADSLNSIVVNSVKKDGRSASYTRKGPVLSFFHKPDLSYYGGDNGEPINVIEPFTLAQRSGTSFAAPWISRKIAYLIHVMGLSREVAKALLIDSAAAWDRKDYNNFKVGYGIVPIRIEEIIHSKDDEIRFVMTGAIEEYETYTYKLPVPISEKGYPYFAKATLAYFPKSDRNQGVDYTSTEMDIHFGRLKEEKGRAVIKSIDCNNQSDPGTISLYEQEARKLFRKWDNVKHISETINSKSRPRTVYPAKTWGLSIKTKERLDSKAGKGLRFGVVVTLKEMNGVNRIDEFIKLAQIRGWIVNTIDVENRIDVYARGEEVVKFE